MKLENKILKIIKQKKITVELIENEIKKYGKPLRWSIVQAEKDTITIDAVLTK